MLPLAKAPPAAAGMGDMSQPIEFIIRIRLDADALKAGRDAQEVLRHIEEIARSAGGTFACKTTFPLAKPADA